MTSPPEATMPLSMPRGLTLVRIMGLPVRWWVMSRPLRGGTNRRLNALITAAATEIAFHGALDLVVARRRLRRQQRRRLHDLPGLAVAALRHAERAPRNLHG